MFLSIMQLKEILKTWEKINASSLPLRPTLSLLPLRSLFLHLHLPHLHLSHFSVPHQQHDANELAKKSGPTELEIEGTNDEGKSDTQIFQTAANEPRCCCHHIREGRRREESEMRRSESSLSSSTDPHDGRLRRGMVPDYSTSQPNHL